MASIYAELTPEQAQIYLNPISGKSVPFVGPPYYTAPLTHPNKRKDCILLGKVKTESDLKVATSSCPENSRIDEAAQEM